MPYQGTTVTATRVVSPNIRVVPQFNGALSARTSVTQSLPRFGVIRTILTEYGPYRGATLHTYGATWLTSLPAAAQETHRRRHFRTSGAAESGIALGFRHPY